MVQQSQTNKPGNYTSYTIVYVRSMPLFVLDFSSNAMKNAHSRNEQSLHIQHSECHKEKIHFSVLKMLNCL